MTQAELNREVARATGETVSEIGRRGFQPLVWEPEPEDLIVNWDALQLMNNVALVEQPKREFADA